mmetsp:Transcript_14508/g.34439  ORF Transcript_14508/g.34439 Transcript_14508/m.34439 type:complete len:232 (-) Transcript_14508:627-1322(-)
MSMPNLEKCSLEHDGTRHEAMHRGSERSHTWHCPSTDLETSRPSASSSRQSTASLWQPPPPSAARGRAASSRGADGEPLRLRPPPSSAAAPPSAQRTFTAPLRVPTTANAASGERQMLDAPGHRARPTTAPAATSHTRTSPSSEREASAAGWSAQLQRPMTRDVCSSRREMTHDSTTLMIEMLWSSPATARMRSPWGCGRHPSALTHAQTPSSPPRANSVATLWKCTTTPM